MDLSFLKELEREKVLEVLQRDKILRALEEERIRKLKSELQELRRKGAKSFSQHYSEKSCARCQRPLGKLWNCGAVCKGCSHRICSKCRIAITARVWKCTVCYAYREVKIRSGEWFLEERAKKFPIEADKQETVGEKLLKSYQRLSNISIVPPTPPPFLEDTSIYLSKPGGLQNSKGFTRSVENLFLSLTTHMKKLSKSQNDVTVDRSLLTADYGESPRKERRSLSDPAINKPAPLTKVPSLPILSKKTDNKEDLKSNVNEGRPTSHLYSEGKKRESICSISSTCTELGNFDKASVTGEIELSIAYNFKLSCLEISVRACKNLAYGDTKRKRCNPYVKIYLLPDKSPHSKLKTAVKKNTVDPVFNETFRYNIERSQLETRTLQASLWHSGTLKRKVFLGEVLISLDCWKFEDNSTQSHIWYQLSSKPDRYEECVPEQYNGELMIKVKFSSLPQGSGIHFGKEENQIQMTDLGQLSVLIIGAKNLPSLRPDGTVNSFVKGCLILPGGREIKQKTPLSKRKACPQWNHPMVFSGIYQAEVMDSSLELSVWDSAPFGRPDRFLGGVRLEKADTAGMSFSSGLPWQQLLRRPNTWHDFTLIIQPNANMTKM
ncbi:synaptotagmin-like protein 3 isoform X1 [Lepisosteus oculatus]|uniref:synaptotagmin-like protein 3 isoform X1 n=1 Tax=Lepisosteus oculatus TaxID=7918 RepID=UPI00073FBA47|nr:PREDICTED: synaptotagmin-like protein 3 isoform X1 [Lepisosteus oculatus]XP_015205015.1 PREDICTED: synaptotagmin-like protein 3 isoform X1 [Lepisosteus oculatus]